MRKKIIAFTSIVSLGLVAYNTASPVNEPITAKITHHNIHYKHHVSSHQLVITLYLLATCAPFIFSSYKHLYFADIITIGFFVAYFTYFETFASVWCFFVAIASALIYFYFAHRIKKPLILIS
ncbi:MAG: hypothetical protein K2Y07_09455 [Nitrosomonas sp.]|nr:hypothetical protein [Nitrosomonas sp.]